MFERRNIKYIYLKLSRKIKEINDDYIVLEIASNVKIKIDKNSIFADASAANSQSATK